MTKKTHVGALGDVLFAQINAIQNKALTDEAIEGLLLLCGDGMLLAALDLIDSNEVSKIQLPSGRVAFQCSGTLSTYSVTLDPLFCPCPAFAQQVLYLRAQVVCKHLLACLIARRLDRFVARNGTLELLASLANAPTAP